MLTQVQLKDGGNYDATVTNAYGFAISSNAALTVINLPIALDATNLTWSTSNTGAWFPQAVSHDGVAAAQNGAVNEGQASVLQTSVGGPGRISFWWRRVNQGSPYLTPLSFLVNGVPQTNVGTPGVWQQVTYYCPTGSQAFKWAYTNINGDGTFHGGWLDQVSFVAGRTPASIAGAPHDRTLPARQNTTFAVSAYGTPPLTYQWQFGGSNITGATKSSYSLVNIQAGNQRSYSVTISNAYGGAATNATLTVSPSAPVFTVQPASQTNVLRGMAVFTGGARDSEPLAPAEVPVENGF